MITARRYQMPNGGLIHPEAMNAAVNRRTRTARVVIDQELAQIDRVVIASNIGWETKIRT